MSNVNQADAGRTYGVCLYLLLILCGGALLTSALFPSAGAESDTTKAGQMQAQLASDMTYNNQNTTSTKAKTVPQTTEVRANLLLRWLAELLRACIIALAKRCPFRPSDNPSGRVLHGRLCSFASIRSPLFNFSLSSSGLPGSDLKTYQEPEGTFFWYQTFPSLRWSKQVIFALAAFIVRHSHR